MDWDAEQQQRWTERSGSTEPPFVVMDSIELSGCGRAIRGEPCAQKPCCRERLGITYKPRRWLVITRYGV